MLKKNDYQNVYFLGIGIGCAWRVLVLKELLLLLVPAVILTMLTI